MKGITLEELGERIRRAREEAGFATQTAFAERLQVSQPTISRAEQGQPINTLLLNEIARVTGKSLDYFLSPVSEGAVAVALRAPSDSSPEVARAVEFAIGLLRDYEFLREIGG